MQVWDQVIRDQARLARFGGLDHQAEMNSFLARDVVGFPRPAPKPDAREAPARHARVFE